ncbi:MAG TPA: glycosyltransferase family 87 protein [Methylomirabilota bacterium]|nr:glycosyltransferase family 87 protein [Methylomirabilota bacterium]
MTPAILTGCALVLAAAFGALAWLGDLFHAVHPFIVLFGLASLAYGLAVVRVVRRPPTGWPALAGILVAAALFRLILLPAAPSLSTDLYRYLWDGRLAAAGVSPYGYPANAPEVAAFRDPVVYPRLNHADWRTVYPPGAQLLFAGLARLAPGSVLGFKLFIVALDLATIALVVGWLRALGRPLAWALVYAWHPLVVVELAGSGHLDAVVLATTVAALWAATRGREAWAGAFLGAGALVKLYPVLLLPAVWRRSPGRALAAAATVLAAGYALYAGEGWAVLGSLARYISEEEFNGSLRAALELLLGPLGPTGRLAARLLPLLGLGVLALVLGLLGREIPVWRRAVWLVGGYLLAAPNLFPWYALWIVPLMAMAPWWPWLYLSCAVALTYVIFAQPVWTIPAWVIVVEFGPVGLGLLLAARPRLWGPRSVAARAWGSSS